MIGDHFIGPIKVDNSHSYQEVLDPREVEAARRGKSPPICAFTNRVIYTHLPFRTIRSLLRNRQDRTRIVYLGTRIVYLGTEEQSDLISHWSNLLLDMLLLEHSRTTYDLPTWGWDITVQAQPVGICHLQHFLCCRQLAVPKLAWTTVGLTLHEHLGYSWHLCKTPKEIYETAKKITDICEIIDFHKCKALVTKQVTIQEIDKCVDNLLQQTSIWGNCCCTQIIALENYQSLP